MDRHTRNLILISTIAAISVPFVVSADDAPITVTLISPDEHGTIGGSLPSSAFARVQKLNSSGTFNDLAFIGSGRALSYEIKRVGIYRVVKGESQSGNDFGVDITSADFAIAPPGQPGPGLFVGQDFASSVNAAFGSGGIYGLETAVKIRFNNKLGNIEAAHQKVGCVSTYDVVYVNDSNEVIRGEFKEYEIEYAGAAFPPWGELVPVPPPPPGPAPDPGTTPIVAD